MRNSKKTSSRNSEPGSADRPGSESLRSGLAPVEETGSRDVDEIVSSFLAELDAIASPPESSPKTVDENEGGPEDQPSEPQAEVPAELITSSPDETTPAAPDETTPAASDETTPAASDETTPAASDEALADLDMRIASALDEIEKEQAKVIPLPLKDPARPQPVRFHPPESGPPTDASVQPMLPPAAEKTPVTPTQPILEDVSILEELRVAVQKGERPIFLSSIRLRSGPGRIRPLVRILLPIGLLLGAAIAWMIWGSAWAGGEDPKIVAEPLPTTEAPASGEATPVKEPPASTEAGPIRSITVYQTSPEYPPQAKVMAISGIVEVAVDLNERGEVVRAVAVSGPLMLRAAAVKALKTRRFEPATKNGIGVRSKIKIPVIFHPQ